MFSSRLPSSCGTRTCIMASEAKAFLENSSSRRPSPSWRSIRRAESCGTRAERMFGRGPTTRTASSSTMRCRSRSWSSSSRYCRPRASRTAVLRSRRDRPVQELNATCSPIPRGGRDETGLLLIVRDVTEQRRWEEQLARSEKLSALGHSGHGPRLHQPLRRSRHTQPSLTSPPRAPAAACRRSSRPSATVETVGRIRRLPAARRPPAERGSPTSSARRSRSCGPGGRRATSGDPDHRPSAAGAVPCIQAARSCGRL
jgi:hypothetical protein